MKDANRMPFWNNRGELLKTLIFIILLGLGVYFEGTTRTIYLVASLVYYVFLDSASSVVCMFCHTLICENLLIVPSVSYGSIIIALFLTKSVLYKWGKGTGLGKVLVASLVISVIQLLSVLFFDNELINVIRFALNLLVLVLFGNYSLQSFKREDTIPLAVSFTILVGGIISLALSRTADNLGIIRFSGIWYDQNFCGMYCVLGIVSSVYAIKYNRLNSIIAIPSVLVSMYMETLGMSRTFIFVISFVSLFLLYIIYRKKSIKILNKILVTIVLAVSLFAFYDRVVTPVVEARGIVSEEGGWTNNRESFSGESLYAYYNTPAAWFTGCGITNCIHFKERLGLHPNASHNTYVDFLVELGFPLAFFIVWILLTYVIKCFKNISRINYFDIICFSILLYMATLTMGQYTILYISIGLMLNRTKSFKKNSTVPAL